MLVVVKAFDDDMHEERVWLVVVINAFGDIWTIRDISLVSCSRKVGLHGRMDFI